MESPAHGGRDRVPGCAHQSWGVAGSPADPRQAAFPALSGREHERRRAPAL